jgi:beta-glucanase (GH16 family)
MKNWRQGFRCAVLLVLLAPLAGSTGSGAAEAASPERWVLVWSDEFNGPKGSGPDPAKWVYDIGGGGWGNQELQTYTDRRQNSYLEKGRLVIKAMRETHTGPDGIAREYTSARLKTVGKYSLTYGRVEARIKIPRGQGLWPAFWMLGSDIREVGWPQCGEIDIMENIGKEPSMVHGTLHGPGFNAGNGLTATYNLPRGRRVADRFHVFAMEWEPEAIRFYVDGHLYSTKTPKDVPDGGKWVFDRPFFLLLNVAVGGAWPGSPDASTVFPQTMQVDYVRVYQRHKPAK